MAWGSQAFPLPDSLLPLPSYPGPFPSVRDRENKKTLKGKTQFLSNAPNLLLGILFPQNKSGCTLSWHRDPTPPTRGQGRDCSPVGTRCRTQPRTVGGVGTGSLMACQVPGAAVQGPSLALTVSQSNCGREHDHFPHYTDKEVGAKGGSAFCLRT